MKLIKSFFRFFIIFCALTFFSDVSYAISGVCKMKYRGMDLDGDCVITQSEWTASDQAFRNRDWNEDGVLSGIEVKPGAKKPKGVVQKDYLNYTFDQVDTNDDMIISRSEWRASSESFNSLDDNRDGVITRIEFENRSSAGYDYRAYRFDQVDTNNDMIISRSEWRGSLDSFNSLDDNRDGVLTKLEFENRTVARTGDPFKDLDTNRDGNISLSEWNQNRAAFDRLDDNRNGLISVQEYHERSSTDRFGELDHNGDGYLVTSEWHGSSRSFSNLDRNRDGKVTRDEYDRRDSGQTVFSELDNNGDDRISRAEWRGSLSDFERLDRNNDVYLTRAEFLGTQSVTNTIIDQIFNEIFR